MDEMNEKIGAILNDPKMMQQIMSMAQALGGSAQEQGPSNKERTPEIPFPDIDMAAVQKLSGLAKQSSIDKREQALLRALAAYLNKDRVNKLEKAMRAAKMARLASSVIGQKGLLSSTGR